MSSYLRGKKLTMLSVIVMLRGGSEVVTLKDRFTIIVFVMLREGGGGVSQHTSIVSFFCESQLVQSLQACLLVAQTGFHLGGAGVFSPPNRPTFPPKHLTSPPEMLKISP